MKTALSKLVIHAVYVCQKVLIKEAQLEDEGELEAEPGRIVIRRGSQPRAGWAAAAGRMPERNEDRFLDPTTRFDETEWNWR